MGAETSTNQSVERAAAVLSTFLDGPSMRVSDVADLTGLGQSTASRLLSTLESMSFVERDQVSSLYRLGPALITLGGAALNQHPVHRAARQPAQNLVATLGLAANVATRKSDTLFYLCSFEGPKAPKTYALTGRHNPLHATGLGKCLLVGLSPAARRALLPTLVPYTAHTVVAHEELDGTVEHVLAHGYASETEELALGRACVAAPIYDQSGGVVAAISVSGPLSTINLAEHEAELARHVIEAADQISIGLGFDVSRSGRTAAVGGHHV